MKQPRIYIISRPKVELEELLRFLDDQKLPPLHDAHADEQFFLSSEKTEDPQLLVEVAGRLCYMSYTGKRIRGDINSYIKNLVTSGHESVLEHMTWSFILTGVSRAFTHQLVRHRIGFSFSQLSQQYVDHKDVDLVFPGVSEAAYEELQPEVEELTNKLNEIYKKMARHSIDLNTDSKERLRNERSTSRTILPNATETRIFVTANARSLRHFLKVRGTTPGDVEMRQVCGLIYEMVNADASACLVDLQRKTDNSGLPRIFETDS